MKKQTLTFLTSTAVAFGMIVAVGGVSLRSTTPVYADSPTKLQKGEFWTCPMHSQVKQSGPGECPICGMDLVKKTLSAPHHEHHDSAASQSQAQPQAQSQVSPPQNELPTGHDRFELSLPQQQLIGVKTGKVTRRALFNEIRAPGRVAFDPELYTAQSEYQEALQQLQRVSASPLADVRHSAARMVESSKMRLKILGLSDAQISALATGKGTSDSQLLLPQSGGGNWIYAEVSEMDLHSITPGLEVEITASSLQGSALKGKVVSVDRILNTTTRTAKVRIEVPQAKQTLRPETYVDTKILAPLGNLLAVPFDAVFDTGKETWVFIAEGNGKFSPRLVRVQLHAGDWIAIESGLKEGDSIVTSANFLIDSESRLRGAALEGVTQ